MTDPKHTEPGVVVTSADLALLDRVQTAIRFNDTTDALIEIARHRTAAEAASRAIYPEWLSDLNNITRALEDEGDRVYFGSTNDADRLRDIVRLLDARAALSPAAKGGEA